MVSEEARHSKMVKRRDKYHLSCDRESGKVGTATRITIGGRWFSVAEIPRQQIGTRTARHNNCFGRATQADPG